MDDSALFDMDAHLDENYVRAVASDCLGILPKQVPLFRTPLMPNGTFLCGTGDDETVYALTRRGDDLELGVEMNGTYGASSLDTMVRIAMRIAEEQMPRRTNVIVRPTTDAAKQFIDSYSDDLPIMRNGYQWIGKKG